MDGCKYSYFMLDLIMIQHVKVAQPVIENKQTSKVCPESSWANYRLVHAKDDFKRRCKFITKEDE